MSGDGMGTDWRAPQAVAPDAAAVVVRHGWADTVPLLRLMGGLVPHAVVAFCAAHATTPFRLGALPVPVPRDVAGLVVQLRAHGVLGAQEPGPSWWVEVVALAAAPPPV